MPDVLIVVQVVVATFFSDLVDLHSYGVVRRVEYGFQAPAMPADAADWLSFGLDLHCGYHLYARICGGAAG